MPLHWVLHSLPLFGALGVLAVCYSYWIVLKAWRESENLAGLILLGLLISSVAFFHDIARAMGFIAAPVEIAPASFLCLIFIQTYALVQRFAESFDQIRELSEQLQTAHNALQQSHTQLQKNHEVVLMELEEARQLGNYQLEEMLGAGGMGEVWRASHRLLARPAAIKLVLSEKFDQSDEQRRLRFEREAQATAQLRSPHTVELYDYGCSPKGEFYYAMELLDGLDLAGFVEHYGPMPAARVIHLLHQACLSLAEAHGQGLIHRDIKPANLFLCRVGVEFDFLKILDFGLVKAQTASETLRHEEPAWPDEVPSELLDSFDNSALSSYETLDASSLHTNSSQGSLSSQNLTIAGMITGTPAYMSPEQITGRAIDGRSDLYALACVAYWLLSARAVFPGDEPATLLFQHMTMEVSPLEKVCKQPVPAELSELILDCLSKSPKDRPKNAIVLLERLEHMRKKYPWTNEEAREWWIRHQPDKKRALETQETLV